MRDKLKKFKSGLKDNEPIRGMINSQKETYKMIMTLKEMTQELQKKKLEEEELNRKTELAKQDSEKARKIRPRLEDEPNRGPPVVHNAFIKNMLDNVNKVFDYEPDKEFQPVYRF